MQQLFLQTRFAGRNAHLPAKITFVEVKRKLVELDEVIAFSRTI